MATTTIRITHAKASASLGAVNRIRGMDSARSREFCLAVADLLTKIAAGIEPGSVSIQLGGTTAVKASATATLTNAIATDVITINGVAFTAVANGAVGNQWNIGADDAADATNLAQAINNSATALVSGVIEASASGNVVTISAKAPGVAGNVHTLTSSAATIVVTGGGRLAGGAGDDVSVVSYTRT